MTGNRRQHARRTRVGNAGRKLGTAGWEFVHVCVDDATRMAFAEVLPDERADGRRLPAPRRYFFAGFGITLEAVMSDNGACYVSRTHAEVCRELGLRHLRTRPYRPRTNGKAERFIQTLTEWAYGAIYGSSAERQKALPGWLTHYNFTRRHGPSATGRPQLGFASSEQRHE